MVMSMSSLTAPPTPTNRGHWMTLAVVGLAQLMVVLDATVVNIALPSAQADLGFTDGQRQWIITAYSLAFGSLLLAGASSTYYRARRFGYAITKRRA